MDAATGSDWPSQAPVLHLDHGQGVGQLEALRIEYRQLRPIAEAPVREGTQLSLKIPVDVGSADVLSLGAGLSALGHVCHRRLVSDGVGGPRQLS